MHNTVPHLLAVNFIYLSKILSWYNLQSYQTGLMYKVEGFNEYNYLVTINAVLSSKPYGVIIDRTKTIVSPFNFAVVRPWLAPIQKRSLVQFCQTRVKNICNQQHRVNLLWSGGIDSTTVVTAFLKHCPNLSQIRILYSPHSTYEHPEYLNFLQKFPNVEIVDISGEVYRTQQFDGVFVTGHGGDELNASLDESFFEKIGFDGLSQPWQDYFVQNYYGTDLDHFIDFCSNYFSKSQREINTILEARWFFYLCCKNTCWWVEHLDLFCHYENFPISRMIPFFDCAEYEEYIFWNTDRLFIGNQYKNFKQEFKNYCFEFDDLSDWHKNKIKTNSKQTMSYYYKHRILNNQRWIYRLENNSTVSTPGLPLLSRKEFIDAWGTSLDYLINEPN